MEPLRLHIERRQPRCPLLEVVSWAAPMLLTGGEGTVQYSKTLFNNNKLIIIECADVFVSVVQHES